MNTKKKSTPRGVDSTAPKNDDIGISMALFRRSLKLITSEQTDPDTKSALMNAFSENSPDFETFVERAERGELIWDLTGPPLPPQSTTPALPRLAHPLAAVLAHPDTPEFLYNDIAEGIAGMATEYLTAERDSPEFIGKVLDHYMSKRETKKARASQR